MMKPSLSCVRTLAFAASLLAVATVWADTPSESLTLAQALQSAKVRNGQIQASKADLLSSRSGRSIAEGAFLPTLTPNYSYTTGRVNRQTGSGLSTNSRSTSATLDLNWQLLDSGTRGLRLRSARNSLKGQTYSATDTLRQTLFSVHRDFYDALRAQELLKVQQAQRERTSTILQQTELRVEIGDAARKDTLQAKADFLNSEVSVLSAENQVSTSSANLKATIGWDSNANLPTLIGPDNIDLPELKSSLEDTIKIAFQNRADVQARRAQLESSRLDVKLAELDAGVQFTLSANANKTFADNVLDRRGLTFEATIPLFDGKRSRETLNQRRLSLVSANERYVQFERETRAEIESAYKQYNQNRQRLLAANAALEAAKLNYEAAREAQRQGASDLVTVLTAQVSLVTAEANRVQALYDAAISQVQLKLVTGEPIPGE